jgi:hypothetical protein
MEYLLVVFGYQGEPEKTANQICEQLTGGFDPDNLRYHFSDKSVILLFSSENDESTLKKKLTEMFGKKGVIFVLLPYDEEGNSINMVHSMYPSFFDDNIQEEIKIKVSVIQDTEFDDIANFEPEEESLFIKKPKKVKKQLSLDELLEKINKVGYNGLTQEEKNLLDKYSENI